MEFQASIVPLAEIEEWDELVARGSGGTIFHEPWYLRGLGVDRALCVRSGPKLFAALPLFVAPNERSSSQSTRSSPYGGPLFAPSEAHPRHDMLLRREAVSVMARLLKETFEGVSFACAPEIQDVVPWIRAGFAPEVRYTYVLDVSVPPEQLLEQMSMNRHRNLARSQRAGVEIVRDEALQHFDVGLAVSWSHEAGSVEATRKMMMEAIERRRGCALVGLLGGKPVGGVFLVWDRRCSYTTYAYHHDSAAPLGVATLLYFEAMKFTRSVLNLGSLDFEGSVLEGVERYYQSFGGHQTLYFGVHWATDRQALAPSVLYDYR
jgi:hypothetical protein